MILWVNIFSAINVCAKHFPSVVKIEKAVPVGVGGTLSILGVVEYQYFLSEDYKVEAPHAVFAART